MQHLRYTPTDIEGIEANTCASNICKPEQREKCEDARECRMILPQAAEDNLADVTLSDRMAIDGLERDHPDRVKFYGDREAKITAWRKRIYEACKPIVYLLCYVESCKECGAPLSYEFENDIVAEGYCDNGNCKKCYGHN